VLLIGDPQIQGYQDEPSFPVGSLARWDIDRYSRLDIFRFRFIRLKQVIDGQ